ncbi:intracellular short-chain-length polyhydroxyalkanoate depolymerase [Acholeplasma hippikon]|uniref:Tropinesterase n=1 Tax=Acholeplasma hippikon TaxID=264636 RepID=A0A449BJT5_9MOLU|nr:alpha/beta hydrolase [Acholeplasma hippikon]VEU82712.1 Tropinesterase [Acholeplasma hippikon]
MEKKSISIGKEELFYYDINKGNRVILAIHGNSSSSAYYSPLFDKVEEGFRLIAPDLRGYGDSSYNERVTSLKDFANDLNLFLEKLNVDVVDVIGWSLGGGVVMELAANYPNKVKTLTLLSSTTHKGYPIFKKNEQGQAKFGEVYESVDTLQFDPVQVVPLQTAYQMKNFDFVKYIYDVTIYTGKNKPTEEQTKLWILDTLKQRNLVDADWALATLNMSNEVGFYGMGTDTIKNITQPTLHLWGNKDLIVPEFMMLDNMRAIKNSINKVYDGCGHSLLVDEITFFNDVIEFIKSN